MPYLPIHHQRRVSAIEAAMLQDNPSIQHITITITRQGRTGIIRRIFDALRSDASPSGFLLALAGE